MPELEDTTQSEPTASAPATIALSPAGWIARCIAVGATAMGDETGVPSSVVARSTAPTPRSTWVLNRSSCQARFASATLTSPYDPDWR